MYKKLSFKQPVSLDSLEVGSEIYCRGLRWQLNGLDFKEDGVVKLLLKRTRSSAAINVDISECFVKGVA